MKNYSLIIDILIIIIVFQYCPRYILSIFIISLDMLKNFPKYYWYIIKGINNLLLLQIDEHKYILLLKENKINLYFLYLKKLHSKK